MLFFTGVILPDGYVYCFMSVLQYLMVAKLVDWSALYYFSFHLQYGLLLSTV